MANHKTGAQRHNDRMDKIFETARRLEKDPSTKSYRRHQRKIGVAGKDKGSHYPGARTKALEAKKNKFYVGHSNTPYKREVFASKTVPTKESHPQYGHVRSGFKNKKDAEDKKNYY